MTQTKEQKALDDIEAQINEHRELRKEHGYVFGSSPKMDEAIIALETLRALLSAPEQESVTVEQVIEKMKSQCRGSWQFEEIVSEAFRIIRAEQKEKTQ